MKMHFLVLFLLSTGQIIPLIARNTPPNSDYAVEYVEDMFDQMTENMNLESTRAECLTACDIVNILTQPSGPILAQERLQGNFYRYTNPPHQRSLLDYPLYTLHQWCLPCHWQFNISFFYNQNSQANFTKEGTTIDSYLDFDNGNLLQDIDQLEFGIDIPTAIELLRNFKLQERRCGFMLNGYHKQCGWVFDVKTPLYYLERNFFLTSAEKEALENLLQNATFSEDDSPPDFGVDTLDDLESDQVNKHFMSDKVGFGDTRLYIGKVLQDSLSMYAVAGMGLTIPTAFALGNGLAGGDYDKNNQHPPLSLFNLFEWAMCEPRQLDRVKQQSFDFLLTALHKLTANLTDTSLGNGGHLGILWFADYHVALGSRAWLKSHSEIEVFLPAHEQRFYLIQKDPNVFVRDYSDCSGTTAEQNLAFLNQQLINTFIPYMVNTLVWPGFIIKHATAYCTTLCGADATLGIDAWWQGKEHIGSVNNDSHPPLNTDIATLSSGFQAKLFGSLSYKKTSCHHDWCISLYFDKTFLSTAIGKDFMLAVHFSMNI